LGVGGGARAGGRRRGRAGGADGAVRGGRLRAGRAAAGRSGGRGAPAAGDLPEGGRDDAAVGPQPYVLGRGAPADVTPPLSEPPGAARADGRAARGGR